MKLISHGPVNSLKMAFMLFRTGLNPMTLEVKGVRAQCPETHSPLIFVSNFFRNISQIFLISQRLKQSIISMALTREMEENCKKH